MPNTYTLIASTVLTGNAYGVGFSSIPTTYTDLVLRCSMRCLDASTFVDAYLQTNLSNYTYSSTMLQGNGSAASSSRDTANVNTLTKNAVDGANATSSTFASVEFYIPNYNSSANKVFSVFGVSENNATSSGIGVSANLLRETSAITSVTVGAMISGSASPVIAGSSFYLYGIKNS
jgi:hypothetical protein